MTPPLIDWAEVPEGPVWFRLTGRWRMGEKLDGALWVAGDRFPLHEPANYEFTAAEQQPGEHARELADCQHGYADQIRLYQEMHADRDRLRDGIERLEQEMQQNGTDIAVMSDEDNNNAQVAARNILAWVARLAALRAGKEKPHG